MTEPAKPLNPDLYAALGGENPCGPAMERTAFLELDGLCTEKPGQYDHLTGTELPATPPEFHAARPVAIRLLEESRDLRPLSQMIQIESHVNGALGLHAAAHLLLHLCETQWEHVHPGPASDEAQMNQRRRALDRIRNRRRVVNALEAVTLFKSKSAFGEVKLAHLLMATGALQAPDGETPPDRAGIAEFIAGADAGEVITRTREALEATAAIFRKLGDFFAEQFERPIQMDPIPAELDKYAKVVAEFEGAAPGPADDGDVAEEDAPAQTGDAAAPAPSGPTGPLQSNEEADALLDDVLAFYARTAPSSPVALILLRVRELRGASFIDWIDATGSNGPEKAAFELAGVDMSALQTLLEGGDPGAEPEEGEEPEQDLPGELLNLLNDMDSTIYELSVTSVTDGGGGSGQNGDTEQSEENAGEGEKVTVEAAAGEHLDALRGYSETLRNLAFSIRSALEAPAVTSPASTRPAGVVNGRSAVKTALEQLAVFHENRDPAAPLQTILRRTKGLVDLNYLDTLAELSPGGGRPALPLIKPQPKSRG